MSQLFFFFFLHKKPGLSVIRRAVSPGKGQNDTELLHLVTFQNKTVSIQAAGLISFKW